MNWVFCNDPSELNLLRAVSATVLRNVNEPKELIPVEIIFQNLVRSPFWLRFPPICFKISDKSYFVPSDFSRTQKLTVRGTFSGHRPVYRKADFSKNEVPRGINLILPRATLQM